jgi:hypothetical protein
MRVWCFAKDGRDCGLCGVKVGAGEIFLSIELDGIKSKKVRCVPCSGQQPPDFLKPPPPPPPREPVPFQNARMRGEARVASMRRLQTIARQPAKSKVKPFSVSDVRDAKALAAGE